MSDQIDLLLGDIVGVDADVIVSAANTDMIMGGGVARDIVNEAGPDVEEEAMQHAPVAVGDVVVTSGGELAARHIIHVAVVGAYAPDIYECTRNVLEASIELEAESLAIPALGTGGGGVDPDQAASDMCGAIRDFLDEGAGEGLQIRIVVFDDEIEAAFEAAMDRTFGTDSAG